MLDKLKNLANKISKKNNENNSLVGSENDKSNIFEGILGDKKNEKELSIKGQKNEEEVSTKKFNINSYILEKQKDSKHTSHKLLITFYNMASFFVMILISIFLVLYIFIYINLDKNLNEKNDLLVSFGSQTLVKQLLNNEKKIFELKQEKKNKLKAIKQYTGEIPDIIYPKNFIFKNLSKPLKKLLEEFYNLKTGKIKKITGKQRKKLENYFFKHKALNKLKVIFEDEYVLNSIINQRIYWKDVYADLNRVTNKIFNYNQILNHVVYNSFTISENGEIIVSGKIVSPYGDTFSKLISLVKGINSDSKFQGATISTFSKNREKDGSFSSAINLKFKYLR